MQTNDALYELVQAVLAAEPVAPQGVASSAAGGLDAAMERNTDQLSALRELFQAEANTAQPATQTVAAATPESGTSTGESAARAAASAAGTGLLLNPLLAGLLSLFGGGSEDSTPATLTKFSLPATAQVIADANTLSPVSYGQNGLPRTTTINVQVNAMDSQSFLDRSSDIAEAVRRAMLESSSLNDVVAEL